MNDPRVPSPQKPEPPSDSARPAEAAPEAPGTAMNALRRKMEVIADEFAQGKINRAQFNAMYKRYSEQRTIIERLLERDPNSQAWKQVIGQTGQTGFLRTHFEAQALYYCVYRHNQFDPILTGGKHKPNESVLKPVLSLIWSMPTRPKVGLGRKPIGATQWLILACGEHSATVVMFSQEPSNGQARLVRDLHADFERANQAALARGWIVPDRMVFPQRALGEAEV